MAARDTDLALSDTAENPTILGTYVRALLGVVAARGYDANVLLEEAGLRIEDLLDIDARVPTDRVRALWDHAAAYTGDPDFGLHFGEQIELRALGVLGYAIESSRSLRDAFDRCVRYNRLVDTGSFRLEIEEARFWVRFRPGPCRQLAESSAAAVATFARLLGGDAGAARIVRFDHPRPCDIAEHERFFRCPIVFDHHETDIAFDAAILDLPSVRPDDVLASYLDRQAEAILATLPPHAWLADNVRSRVAKSLGAGEVPSAESVARSLGFCGRTLHRRLRTEGTTYRALVDSARYALAQRLLREQTSPIEEIAYMLGFSEMSAFSRAFKRWSGHSPRAFRAAGSVLM